MTTDTAISAPRGASVYYGHALASDLFAVSQFDRKCLLLKTDYSYLAF